MQYDQDMHYGSDYHYIPATSVNNGEGVEVRPDLYCFTVQIVNVIMAGHPGSPDFVLIDAGMPHSAPAIIEEAEGRFGRNCRPKAIVLTHGHFDHVGAIIELVQHWQVPVYAHEAELPYLTGRESYPKPDPGVQGGLVAKLSFMFPNEPIQLSRRVKPLPEDGTVPELPDFRWIHTPGHSKGHVSLYRESDRTLIAGDAVVTVEQESLYSVITQAPELNGPPAYFTPDWEQAKASVQLLAELKPEALVSGHGQPMFGEELQHKLDQLAQDFDTAAKPKFGKYVH
ncbi:glyoxylase-like metal-dependent hydrolase (beta-lactamase superfamily II) [Paenibacillus phyllosphaerae]|uniref:Glyoxylase-like metal-dependent hydrolase (Beta-lactamase superfamily II) n=1 Tax=Paenibacillus phyllosphaerae TaxID=274593 RepID=A0A7W5FP42_9BACL|nr:MBL fold metallo-hydrolase [Paenibacillus phyllosphaerae]MBB3111853.1 glyoxylase-like metal-dependent hydrolase (beta-lactamase superfamily II) [Paenibacillus phyllosphaerae]